MAERVRVESAEVVAFAETAKVDLATITNGHGKDGRISKGDVLHAALCDRAGIPRSSTAGEAEAATIALVNAAQRRNAEAEARAEADAVRAAAAASTQRYMSASSRGPRYQLNPLVAGARAAMAQAKVPETKPAPTLFASGDLPSFTASGIPVDRLLEVPWEARHALAAATTQAEAFEIVTKCTAGEAGMTGEQCAGDYAGHYGNAQYAERVTAWRRELEEATIDEDAWVASFDRRPASLTGDQ